MQNFQPGAWGNMQNENESVQSGVHSLEHIYIYFQC